MVSIAPLKFLEILKNFLQLWGVDWERIAVISSKLELNLVLTREIDLFEDVMIVNLELYHQIEQ